MTNPCNISVIIPTYNRSDLLRMTLDSLREQTMPKENFEVIVVDDGSGDDTAEIVAMFSKDLEVKYHFHEDLGRRVSLSRNIGIQMARGEYCLFIDSGMTLASACLFDHLDFFSRNSPKIVQLGSVFGFSHFSEHDEELRTILQTNTADAAIASFRLHRRFLDMRDPFFKRYHYNLPDLPEPWVFCWTGNLSVSRQVLINVGLFDTNYDQNWGMEDIDLGYRLFLNGHKFMYNEAAGSIHIPHEKDMHENLRQNSVNKVYFYQKFKTDQAYLFLHIGIELNDLILDLGRFKEKESLTQN